MSLVVSRDALKTRTISARIPASLAAELDSLRADAEKVGYVVDISGVVVAALQKAVKDARAEIDKLLMQQQAHE